jgi:hypothetical protein
LDDEHQPEPTPTLRSLSTPSSSVSAGLPLLSQLGLASAFLKWILPVTDLLDKKRQEIRLR